MTAPADVDVDKIVRRVPGTHLPEVFKVLRIEWPTRDPDLEEQEEYAAFLDRIKDALVNLPTSGSAGTGVPRQLTAADAEVLRPVVTQLRAADPDADFSFFAPFEPDAAGSHDA